jgi:hypothetical protein
MSTFTEKSYGANPNGLTLAWPAVTRQSSSQSIDLLTPIEDAQSNNSLTPASSNTNEKVNPKVSPFSPFYNPSPSRRSLEAQRIESRQSIIAMPPPYDADVEAGVALPPIAASSSKTGLMKHKNQVSVSCTMWPDQQAMKLKKKEMRKAKAKYMLCGWMAGYNRATRIWIKILIAVVVIGAAVGVGVGISRATGGGVWKNQQNSNSPIAHRSDAR